ncbi:hypothetical protein SAMN05661080_04175 [Modestobacter sp. DSM 44400]|nr:hypothetical protein SAMN05661080_04175 [Modestobacter sp. DSM 44400]
MTLLIPVAVLGATGAAVYLLSLRPLPQARRGDGRGGVGRGPAAGAGVDLDAQLRDAGAELARLRRAPSATGGTAVSSAGAVRTGVQRPPNVDHGWESGLERVCQRLAGWWATLDECCVPTRSRTSCGS